MESRSQTKKPPTKISITQTPDISGTFARRVRRRVQLIDFEPTLTKQEFGEECDLNAIVARHGVRGAIALAEKRPGLYGDFTEVPDYMAAQNVVAKANEQFAALPSQVREKFGNDPSRMLEFVNDPDNEPLLVKYGLAKKREQFNERENIATNVLTPAVENVSDVKSQVPEGSKVKK